jgi:hypothetical protein
MGDSYNKQSAIIAKCIDSGYFLLEGLLSEGHRTTYCKIQFLIACISNWTN